ncbi:MAG: hypothetical protein IPJ81_08105 [Chitinophagaceae bacterium]|nr:hypothetical protein [Chitinophagaceae bacterium]
MEKLFLIILTVYSVASHAQKAGDTSIKVGTNVITLSEIVVNNKLNVPAFIEIVKVILLFIKLSKI